MIHRLVRIFSAAAFFLLLSSVQAGTIKVNSSTDGAPANDGFITLREALLIARGDRTPFEHPDPDVDDEVFSMGILLIVGEVGAGISDTIQVLNNAGPLHVLVDYLPPLDDSTDSISASSATVLDGGGLDPGGFAFDLTDDDHGITGFTVQNFPGDAIRIASRGASIFAMIVQNNGGHGFVFVD